jgi:hypothetical protein
LTGERYSLAFLILLSLKSFCPGALDVLPRECFGTAPTDIPTLGTLHAHIFMMNPC